MSELQDRLLKCMREGRETGKSSRSLDAWASALGYRPAKNGRLAVLNALRSLEALGLVDWFRSRDDRWGVMLWFALQKPKPDPVA